MSDSSVDVLIVGAGPYGLSLASHLSHVGIERRIVGKTMEAWRNMPERMFLKSFGFAATIHTGQTRFTLPDYCRDRGVEGFEPVAIDHFIDYGQRFQDQFVPDVEQRHVARVARSTRGFAVTLDTGERVAARRVVVATGLSSFEVVPAVFRDLPPEVISHTARGRDYARLNGRDVTVVGAGQSALEAAALLHELGARVRLIARRGVRWSTRVGNDRPWYDKLWNPTTLIGTGRKHWVIEHVPTLLRYVPTERRVRFTRGYLGPLGAWWLRSRVDGQLPVHEYTAIQSASMNGTKIALTVTDADGTARTIETDHIVAGTGYAVNVDRLPFMDRSLANAVLRIEQAPKLSHRFESSVPGLYFVGPASAFSFGPLFRFVAGSGYTVPVVARSLARTADRRVSARAVEAARSGAVPGSSAIGGDQVSPLR